MSSILYEKAGGIGTLTINRPKSRNAVTFSTVTALYRQLQECAEDLTLKALVLRGSGADFCAGADIKAYDGGTAEERIEKPASATAPYQVSALLHDMPAVTIAAVRGACAGAGFGWACACDLRVGAPGSVFNTAFLDVAVAGDMGGPWLLPRIVGSGKARDLYFFPRKVRGEEAAQIGLIDRLFKDETFEDDLKALTDRLDGSAPLALAGMKRNFVEAERVGLSTYIELEALRHSQLFATKDREEAFRAFVEKRPAKFQGK